MEKLAEATESMPNGSEPVTDAELIESDEGITVNVEGDKKVKVRTSANTYAAKKTVAQGMMDIALITANANQLRYILEFGQHNAVFYTITTLIVISLLLQIAVGVCLIFKGRFDMAGDSKHRHANRMNNYVVMGVFLVTLINVFVATFTITPKVEGRGNIESG